MASKKDGRYEEKYPDGTVKKVEFWARGQLKETTSFYSNGEVMDYTRFNSYGKAKFPICLSGAWRISEDGGYVSFTYRD